jgi:hypothetical protein
MFWSYIDHPQDLYILVSRVHLKMCILKKKKIKVKLSHYRPGEALGVT